ncbi:MAG TPA: hypothetical protein VFN91_18115, partial [Myxococcaceae bacterium]|nr:hypothetical protein [Myxococcaceae bacterium]
GDAVRAVAALRRGDVRAVERCNAISLVFESKPDWALRAVRAAFSLPEFPYVFRTRGGAVQPASEAELGALTAALTAVTLLLTESSGHEEPAEAVLCIDGDEFRAVASAPRPLPTAPSRPPGSPARRGDPAEATRALRLLPTPRREDMN